MERARKGERGEEIARTWIQKHLRMKILEVNFRSPLGEIDLIGWDGESFVFVEVKTRFGVTCGLPEEAVDDKKQKRIRKVAEFYLVQKGCNPHEVPVRFDVVAIRMEEGKPEITYYKGAF
ncbi:MAG: YraN family protein [Candidatus Caldatribacteriaceae bacterium]